jgi:8-oxo-dGTP pyrophosphatase MutT (NUDIX family)
MGWSPGAEAPGCRPGLQPGQWSAVTFDSFDELCRVLSSGLANLPGLDAQCRMAPVPRRGWKPGWLPDAARPAAALLVLYPVDEAATLLLTKRSSGLPQHSGQVSLPGGAVDAGEEVEAAALREAHEEVGIRPESVTVLGSLTPMHIPVSGFVLHPFVGTVDERPLLAAAPDEVSRIMEVRVTDLLDPGRHCRTTYQNDGREYDVPYFDLDGEQVWGATAMILAEFAAVLGVAVDPR